MGLSLLDAKCESFIWVWVEFVICQMRLEFFAPVISFMMPM